MLIFVSEGSRPAYTIDTILRMRRMTPRKSNIFVMDYAFMSNEDYAKWDTEKQQHPIPVMHREEQKAVT